MKKLYTIATTLAIALMTINSSYAQVNFGGTTMSNDIVTWNDLYELSFTTHNYGTARSMGMGNAFTALGADMVSASLNPAGIGMYVGSDVSITPIMQFTKSPTSNSQPFSNFEDHSERFGLANAGAVFTAYKGKGALTNINVGFVYNRIADFNQNTAFSSYGYNAENSIANAFRTLSNVDGLKTLDDGTMPFGNDPFNWGPTLAYKTGLTNKDSDGWFIDRIGGNAIVDQFSAEERRGSLGEYALTAGFNFMDIVYVGASLGFQSLNYKREVYYGENYSYAEGTQPSGEEMPYQLEYMNYAQWTRLTGNGVNVKIGVTGRPVHWFRIGVAYHSPTFYTMAFRYGGEMSTGTKSVGDNPDKYDIDRWGYVRDTPVATPIWEDTGDYSWEYRTPSRLLAGVAFTISDRVIISADYERSWYQTIRLTGAPIHNLSYTDSFKEYFKGSNTVRVGAEGYILPFLAARVGYIWSGSTLREGHKEDIFSRPLPTEQWYLTAGLGIKFNDHVYLDVAYQYGTTKYSSYMTHFANGSYTVTNPIDDTVETVDVDIRSNIFTTKTNRHIAVITLGYRF